METQQNIFTVAWQEADAEEWRPITINGGIYAEHYEVSSWGQVRSLSYRGTGQPRVLKVFVANNGYKLIPLQVNGKQNTFTVHRLVAHEFLGPRPDSYQINHIDLDKLNNRATNLEYVTSRENVQHAMRMRGVWQSPPRGERNGASKLTAQQVQEIRTQYTGKRGDLTRLARQYGVARQTVRSIIDGEIWQRGAQL